MTAPTLSTSQKNFQKILFAASGVEDLEVGSNGVLTPKDEADWITWAISYVRAPESEKVRFVVEHMLRHLNEYRETFEACRGTKATDSEIQHVILEKLCQTPPGYFNRHALYDYHNLQSILVPELGQLREQKQTDGFDKENPQYRMAMALAKARLMFKLKVGIQLNKGSSRSIIVNWFSKKPIAIFKPENREGTWSDTFMDYLKYQIGMQISHLKTCKMARPRAEVAVHIIDRYFKIGITCPTIITTFENSSGSFQLFAHGMVEAKQIKPLMDAKVSFHDKEVKNFQIMAILDYLIGDLDGHEENWLVKKGSGGCLIEDLRKIDNANSFIQRNPQRSFVTDSKQYAWSEWRIAQEKFTEDSRELMHRLTEEGVDHVIRQIREDLPGFLDTPMMDLFRQRAEVLRTVANFDSASPNLLGKLLTDDEIAAFLTEHRPAEQIADEFTEIQS